ncbi:hypothetical protein [Desulfatitalea alkaliphila]|uniref:Uncharacterized protein n=1 Tax=Desulfatitalea alkaliphila TaxID=2929485 RepID=A0AA41R926_9BACT|nr:hypothetical protein [Desulfatitalea alkaliphila]MCJ8501083.1 hypothetical protein [Desulfatitalea alkaliphila]
MRNRRLLILMLTIMIPALYACGGGGHHHDDGPPPSYAADILSDQFSDGDIAYYPADNYYDITQGPDVLFFGIDDDVWDNPPEYRAFLDFPLDGATGYDAVPSGARILSATLEIFIDTVEFDATVPTLIELVSYTSGSLQAYDFSSEPLAEISLSLDFFRSDVDNYVSIDVTPLMREAQRLGLLDLQLRFVLDYEAIYGFVGIQDPPTLAIRAPLLSVVYE